MYIFQCTCNVIIPILMVVFGILFEKKPPKKINDYYGYRTVRSMRNMDTWVYAHRYAGNLYKRVFIVVLILSIIISVFMINFNSNIQIIVDLILLLVQTIILVGCIPIVERELKRRFGDE